jgi:broad specificity phosphatase PhoE
LANLPIESIYTSPLQRACATAEILAEPHGLKPAVFDELTEVRLGDWQGLHMDEIERRWPELWYQWRTDPSEVIIPNGESLPRISERAVRALLKIIGDNLKRQVLIVTHEVIVKVLAIYALGASNSVYRRFEVSNASQTVIEASSRNSRLIRLNDISHLEG